MFGLFQSLFGGGHGASMENVTLDELKRGLKDGSIYLIDVREKSEWDAGHIPGAHFLPLSSFDPKKIPAAKEGQRIVVYCRSGNRSGRAIGIAQASGRTDVKANFSGSMNAWLQAGEPVAR